MQMGESFMEAVLRVEKDMTEQTAPGQRPNNSYIFQKRSKEADVRQQDLNLGRGQARPSTKKWPRSAHEVWRGHVHGYLKSCILGCTCWYRTCAAENIVLDRCQTRGASSLNQSWMCQSLMVVRLAFQQRVERIAYQIVLSISTPDCERTCRGSEVSLAGTHF